METKDIPSEKKDNRTGSVLVTGGSGFIGAHCVLQLLEAGYRVRTTVRSLSREAEVRAMLASVGSEPGERLSFVAADLLSNNGWEEAVAGCDYVLHVASPFPLATPKNEDELIIPAREGALRVLRAARDAGVKRVVMTSSFAAVGYSPKPSNQPYTEEDWTNPDEKGLSAYAKSKTLAEKAAWEFMTREGVELELAVINPTGVFGPVLGKDYSTSIEIVKRLMEGSVPGCPRVSFGIVDVRDVADLHLRAMTNPAAKDKRYLAIAGDSMSMHEIALVLRKRLGKAAERVPTKELPDWMVRFASLFDSSLRQITPTLGKVKNASNQRAREELGWIPRSNEEAIVATAESMIRMGLLKNPNKVK